VAATGIGAFSGISLAEKVTGDAKDFITEIQKIEQRHGPLTAVEPKEVGNGQIITLTFKDEFQVRARLRKVGQQRAKVTLGGNVYQFEKQELHRPRRKYKPQTFGNPRAYSVSTKTTELGPGDSLGLYIADGYAYQDNGDSFGLRTLDHDLREYKAEAGVNAAAIGYRTVVTDVYSEVYVDSSVEQLELDYSCDYSWTNGALGSAATSVEGEVVIYNVTTDTAVTKEELFKSGGTFYKFKDGSDTVSKLTSAKVFGNATYRVGIRATASVDAYGTAVSNASIAGSDYIDIGDMDITAE
jgi:hypothetical protein